MSRINSISALGETFRRMAQDLKVESYFKSFHTTPHHDGSPHIELVDGKFHFVVTERGIELERRMGLSADEVLYLLFDGITQHMATQYELENRKESQDGRLVWFPYQEKLMGDLNPSWGERLKSEHAAILREHPFRS